MKKITCASAVRLVCAWLTLAGVATSASAQQVIVDQFEKRSHTLAGFTLPYRLFVPVEYDSTISYPLVLALHGAGERGTDNERHIVPHRLATSWADPANQAANPAFVVAPQVPPGGRWTADLPVDQSEFNREELTTLAILDSLETEFNIDPNRVYVTGLSMGGHGTWDLISRLPHRFAVAIPMSGNADPTQASKLLHIPIWSFHGESDTVVRPFSARGLVQSMEDLGRAVIYTDCRRSPVLATNFDCPGTMPMDTLAHAIAARADLIHTSVRNGGHGPWSVWYDHPLLADWLFSKRRVTPDTISILEPSKGATWTGLGTVTWASGGSASDSVEVWLSRDDGVTWVRVGKAALGDGGVTIDTVNQPDAGFVRVRLFALDEHRRVYGKRTSDAFSIDNVGDAAPQLFVNDESLRFTPIVTSETLDLMVAAADPEGSMLDASVSYSIDGGSTFALVQSFAIPSSVDPQILSLDVVTLPNSSDARLRVDVSDGVNVTSSSTASFVKDTPRMVNDYVERIAGEGVGTVRMHFIEPGRLTNHRYRITFDDSDLSAKTYSVFDLDIASTVLSDVPLSDGITESPVFDGMSLVVQDLKVGMANLERTGWVSGETDLGVSITGGSVLIAVLRVQLLETETDYEITVTEAVSDTSIAMFGIPAQELYFTVTSRADGTRRKVLYRDAASDGRLGGGDLLYILESDGEGGLAPAWQLRFSASASTLFPQPGDTFLFVPLRKLSASDVFEFVATVGVHTEELPRGEVIETLASYPNPFLDRVTTSFRLASPAEVKLEVFDVIGRRISILLDRSTTGGEHHVSWNGSIGGGAMLASGLLIVQLTARPLDGRMEQTVRRPIVHVR